MLIGVTKPAAEAPTNGILQYIIQGAPNLEKSTTSCLAIQRVPSFGKLSFIEARVEERDIREGMVSTFRFGRPCRCNLDEVKPHIKVQQQEDDNDNLFPLLRDLQNLDLLKNNGGEDNS